MPDTARRIRTLCEEAPEVAVTTSHKIRNSTRMSAFGQVWKLETVVALVEIDVGREGDLKYNRRHYAEIRGRQ